MAPVRTTSPPAPPRVLVVDDDPAIRLICSTWLSLDGYEVLEAPSVAFQTVALEPFMVKGKAHPVHAFAVGAIAGSKRAGYSVLLRISAIA